MRISHLQLFLKICLKLNFRQIKNVVLWYHQEREKEREERKKRERQERAGFPSPFTPNPLRREKRESKEREKREKERVPASGEKLSWRCVRGVCRLCGGKGRTGGKPCVNVYLLFNGNNTAYIFILKQPYAGYIM